MEEFTKDNTKRNKTLTLTTASLTCRVGKNHFSIFPEEVWLMILKLVQSHVTLQNLVNAVDDFPSVFREQLPVTKFIKVSPFTFRHQPTMETETLPLLDKNWCVAVGNFLKQNLPAVSAHINEENPDKNEPVPTLAFSYLLPRYQINLQPPLVCSTVKEIRQFHLKLKENKESTALPHIKLSHKKYNHKLYFEACTALFSEYGQLLQSVSMAVRIRFGGDSTAMRALLHKIANCLQLLPKVETLSINVIVNGSRHVGGIDTDKFPLLPCLKNLEILSPKFSWELENCIQNCLLECFIKSGYFKTGPVRNVTLLRVVNDLKSKEVLKAYVIHRIERKDNAQNAQEFFRFLLTQKIECVVVKLKQPINDLFLWITAMQLKTEELVIETPKTVMYGSDGTGITPQPTVRYLKLVCKLLTGLEFLTALPSLEYLHIQYRHKYLKSRFTRRCTLSGLLFNYLYEDRIPENCNIWNKLPTLKLLIVEHVSTAGKPTFKHFVRKYENIPVVFTDNYNI